MKSIAAAFVFFTRLPFWRFKAFQVDPRYFNDVINYWAVVGWLTGGVMAATLFLSSYIFPYYIAVILALLSRLFITGALHEDGLADFFDGFGGGNTKDRILAIMKDSHIGTYGVLGLICYFLLFYNLFIGLNLHFACFAILIGDPLCKLISAQITRFLAYARTAETSKSKAIYTKVTTKAFLISLAFGILPLVLFFNYHYLCAIAFPIVVFCFLVYLMRKKIQGYTGDCCGAMFLLCEISFYLGVVMFNKIL